jgi:hypothetical protein
LEGYVRESEDNDPIPGALVLCGVDSAITNASGFYQLTDLWAGARIVSASKLGYITETDTVEIIEDSTSTLNFFLPQPLMGTSVSSVNVALEVRTAHDEPFYIYSIGNGTLTYDIRITGAGEDEGTGGRGVQLNARTNTGNGPIRRVVSLDETDDPWVSATPRTGSVAAQDTQLVTLSFMMPDTTVGTEFEADMAIYNNSIVPEYHIPITVTIIEVGVTDSDQPLPLEYALYQNYPNPFNPITQIRFDLREPSHVVIEVFDVLGRKVTTLVDNPMNAGRHTVEFDATKLASGLYFYRISANDFSALKKMVLIK